MTQEQAPVTEALRDWQLGQMSQELRELKERVTRLEIALTRGMFLLIANLAAVIASLGQQVLRH